MGLKIKYLGHSSFILQFKDYKILTDPFFTKKQEYKKRLINCSESVDRIPKLDSILISHEHFDSLDIKNTNYLSKKFSPKIIAHQSVLNKIAGDNFNKISMVEYQTKQINNINFTAYPAHHPTSFYPLSYIIKYKKNTVFFAGDTFMTKEHENIKADVAILPIGGKRTMDLCSAARVAKKIKPKYLIPMHYNTFEDIKQNPEALSEKIDGKRFSIKTVVLKPGKKINIK